MSPATLPLKPLEDLAFELSPCDMRFDGGKADGTFTDRMFADMVGVSYRTVMRWRANGGVITWDVADEAAIHLGQHPILVWGDEWVAIDGDPSEWDARTTARVDRALDKMSEELARRAAETAEAVVG